MTTRPDQIRVNHVDFCIRTKLHGELALSGLWLIDWLFFISSQLSVDASLVNSHYNYSQVQDLDEAQLL